MELGYRSVLTPRLLKVVAAVVVGLSIGAMIPPDTVLVPFLGETSSIVVGASGLVAGAALYLWVPAVVAPSGCECAGECGCS